MDKRYQVFVSSTYKDLEEERQEVIQALLELDCIPAGMELFPAANDDQWALIRRLIDDCDYYILIVGGRYGSIGNEGISYTEMEYRYALEAGKPIIAFIHKSPDQITVAKTEQSPESKIKLKEFINLVERKVCKYWLNSTELGSQVSRSIVNLIKTNPAIGWVRADLVPEVSASEEILKLKKQIDQLNTILESERASSSSSLSDLAQGNDQIGLMLHVASNDMNDLRATRKAQYVKHGFAWNDIFAHISPKLVDEADEYSLKNFMDAAVSELSVRTLFVDERFKGRRIKEISLTDGDFQTIKVQFKALGLIDRSSRNRSVKNVHTYWTLTQKGDTLMTKLRAIKRVTPEQEVNDSNNI